MDYWIERNQKTLNNLSKKSIKETDKQLQKYYKNTMKTVINDFEATYDKLLANIAEGESITPANLYRLDRYWQLQAQLKTELQKLGDNEVELLSKKFTDAYSDFYKAIAIKDELSFGKMDDVLAKQMVNKIWCADGKSWSDRVWGNTDKLQQALNDRLTDCVITGRKTTELKKVLQSEFKVGYSRANTLVKTEIAHLQTDSATQRYKEYGIQEVEILVDADERTCPICGKLDGSIYKINDKLPVPAHPNCRCTIIPVVKTK